MSASRSRRSASEVGTQKTSPGGKPSGQRPRHQRTTRPAASPSLPMKLGVGMSAGYCRDRGPDEGRIVHAHDFAVVAAWAEERLEMAAHTFD